MQVSGSYALGSIFTVSSGQARHTNSIAATDRQFDTVSISDEARLAYENAATQNNELNDAQLEAKLTKFFNMWHSGADFPVNKNIKVEYGKELLPENKQLLNAIEKQIEKILDESNYKIEDGVAPDELISKLRPWQQKLNAIHAIGDVIVLDEAVLNSSASFLQELENAWSEAMNEDVSLAGQLHSATHTWKEQPHTEEEIRKKIEEKKSETLDSLSGSDSVSKSVYTAKQLAESDARTEQDILDFWKIPSIIGKYTPDALRFSDNLDALPKHPLESEEAKKQLNQISEVFSQAFSELGIEYESLSLKEKYYLMQDERISTMAENTFLNILHKTNRMDLLSGVSSRKLA